jgi:Flp pilus assembly protein TadG
MRDDRHHGEEVMRVSRRQRRGQSLVEFALILLPFLMILIGLFDAGRAIYGYNTVSNAAREAARVAIVDQTSATVVQAAIDSAAGLGLTAADVDFDDCAVREQFCTLTVTVTWNYQPITPLIGDMFNPTISSSASMPVEVVNPPAP